MQVSEKNSYKLNRWHRPAEQLVKEGAEYPEWFGRKNADIIEINMFKIMKCIKGMYKCPECQSRVLIRDKFQTTIFWNLSSRSFYTERYRF